MYTAFLKTKKRIWSWEVQIRYWIWCRFKWNR